MDCPKCGHQQADTVKCESCGVYFAKLQRPAPATGAMSGGVSHSPPAGPGIGVGALVVTAPVTAAGVYGLMREHGPTESANIANYQPAMQVRESLAVAPSQASIASVELVCSIQPITPALR